MFNLATLLTLVNAAKVPASALVGVVGVLASAFKVLYGTTHSLAGRLPTLADVKHILAFGPVAALAILKVAIPVITILSGVALDFSNWGTALVVALTTIATGIAKYVDGPKSSSPGVAD